MLLRTEDLQGRHTAEDTAREYREYQEGLLYLEMSRALRFRRENSIMEAQKGRMMTPRELEQEIDKLAGFPGKFVFLPHPRNTSLRVIYLAGRLPCQNDPHPPFVLYMNTPMPEFDIMTPIYDEVPAPGVGSVENPLNRKMIERGEHKVRIQKGEVLDVVGWRNVLVKLVERGFLSAESVLRAFNSDSLGWNHFLKGNAPTPLVS